MLRLQTSVMSMDMSKLISQVVFKALTSITLSIVQLKILPSTICRIWSLMKAISFLVRKGVGEIVCPFLLYIILKK